ncbi:YbhB/YbcL family Raf kinase inhibitor-like protein [Nonomuraea typhae]|uniref:YbhB/YbcL family Raf kinase inhibitor-like protein n=1 Tax=Nonomuraea typhae TaxID=2603600 RepID=UPI0012F70E71|nr:YbhB/YbcL family Raf kinase inhibitor-like protein [Nonomuraea typhae]
MRSLSRARALAGALVAALLMSVVAAVPASAAPARHEAEDATVSQGLVESNHPGFSGTGFVNGDNVAGSYTEFTVNAASAGQATIGIRYANGTTVNRPSDVAVNGVVVSAARAFTGTGAWSTWVTSTLTASLNAGANKIRLTSTTANGNPNLDFLDVEVAAPSTDLQAEDATISQGVVESNHAGFTGRGFVNYDNVTGSYVEFTINAPTAGNYEVKFRFANGTTVDRPLSVAVNGGAATDVGFPGTGAWTTWVEKPLTVPLIAGANKLRATASTANGGPNLDRISTTVPADPEPPTAPANLRVVGEVRPTAVDLAWDPATDNVGVASYVIYNGGNVLKTVGGNQTTATVTGLTPNTGYVLSVLAYDGAGNASQGSNNVPITTPPSDDHQAPTVPGNLRSTSVSSTSITLTWDASTDNVEVTGYNVYRDGTKFATVPDLTATASGLTQNTEYAFQAEAFDANGNVSAKSAELKVRTSSTAIGGDPIFDRAIAKLDLPWGVAFLPDGSALVAERDRFEIVRVTATGQKTVVGKITEAVTTTGEGGLMGLAVSPNFASDHYVYAMHTASGDNRVVRFRYENNTIGPREAIVTGIAKNKFHNGGRIKFGPDGMLYITTGDGQVKERAQDLNSLNGKILRVTPTGAGAPGNPFPNAPRVYSLGHRNPQGLAWDSQGRLWAAEFGDGTWDELNLIQAGKNYGWSVCEGTCSDTRYVNPVRQWSVSSASPSGIEIVNDWIYMAAVRGTRLWVMKITGNTTDTPRAFFNGDWGRLRTVAKTPDGGLWLTSTNNDKNGGTPTTIDNDIVRLKFAGPPFSVTSTAFAHNGTIPAKFTCSQDGVSGNDISPQLAWSNGPAGAQSYAITFIDTANGGKHWAIWDIPASRTSLPEGLGLGFQVPNQSPAKQKAMGSGNKALQYFGPCPGGSTHKYEFTLYALDTATLPGVTSSSTVAQVETAILARDLASAKLAGNSNASTG